MKKIHEPLFIRPIDIANNFEFLANEDDKKVFALIRKNLTKENIELIKEYLEDNINKIS